MHGHEESSFGGKTGRKIGSIAVSLDRVKWQPAQIRRQVGYLVVVGHPHGATERNLEVAQDESVTLEATCHGSNHVECLVGQHEGDGGIPDGDKMTGKDGAREIKILGVEKEEKCYGFLSLSLEQSGAV